MHVLALSIAVGETSSAASKAWQDAVDIGEEALLAKRGGNLDITSLALCGEWREKLWLRVAIDAHIGLSIVE